MGIFSSIKGAIFGDSDEDKAKDKSASKAAAAPAAVGTVDVAAKLDGMAGADKLKWRDSIVDLLTLIGVDPSFANRKELAGELGDTNYSGSADENIWLHKKTMKELANNGGNVPPEFLD